MTVYQVRDDKGRWLRRETTGFRFAFGLTFAFQFLTLEDARDHCLQLGDTSTIEPRETFGLYAGCKDCARRPTKITRQRAIGRRPTLHWRTACDRHAPKDGAHHETRDL